VLLARRFGPQVAPAVVPLLRADDPLLRAKACEALAVGHATGAADALAAVVDDRSVPVRLAAALALASMNDRRTEAALRALVGDERTRALWQPHFALARGFLSRGDLASARAELATVVQLTPYNADALTLLADVTARLGDVAAARALLQEALRFDPQHAGALARLKGG
jgi:Flp pilus assembly protein TadD